MISRGQAEPVSLYLHFPFCERKCRYCDFLSGPASEETREEYIRLLCRETALRGQACKRKRAPVDTIFLGGGTPSLMTPAQIEKVMETIRDTYNVEPDAEISMEVNPGTADITKLRAYRESGINRLSIGVQSFDDNELKLLGRIHTADQAREIFLAAREAGFNNINLDLMSALPGQTLESWSRTLHAAVELGPEHISAYSLIIEEGTPFAVLFESGRLPALPSEEEDREIYHFTGKFLAKNGYRRYEISNYARELFACRHNCGYWTGHEYLGLGLGASSDLFGERFRNPDNMEEYRRAVEEVEAGEAEEHMSCCLSHADDSKGHAPYSKDDAPHSKDDALRCERQRMTVKDRMEEFMFLGLRMTEGVSEKEFKRRFGKTPDEVFGDVIKKQMQQGVIIRSAIEKSCPASGREGPVVQSGPDEDRSENDHRIALTEYGLDVANHVMAEYLL